MYIEKELKEIACPERQGVNVLLKLDDAQIISSLKIVASKLRDEVIAYIAQLNSRQWEIYPRPPDKIEVDGFEFFIRPDVLRNNKVSLQWVGSDEHFLSPEELEEAIRVQMRNKLAKLDSSLKQTQTTGISILLVENNDIAAQNFYSFCGVFARLIACQPTQLTECWGVRGGAEPILLWFASLDHGRTNCVYSEDSAHRTYAQIESARMWEWKRHRLAQISNSY